MMKFIATILLLFVGFANFADLPPTEALKAEIEAELKKKVESRIEPKALALKYRLPMPVLKPTMTRQEIEKSIAAEIAGQFGEKYPDRDEEFAAAAAKKFPMVNVREEITVQVKRGGVTKGVLYENQSSYIKVSSYRINKLDLVGESLALVDAEANAKYRKRHIYKERQMAAVAKERLSDAIREDHGRALFVKHGYVSRNGKWMAQNELLDAAIAHETRLLRKKYGPHIKKAVLEKYGFTLVEGRWKRPEPVALVAAVEPEPEPEPEPAAITIPDGLPPEAVAMVEQAMREQGIDGHRQQKVQGTPPPPAPQGDWNWTLPSKPYSLTRDKDLPTRDELWKIEMARPEPPHRYHAPALDVAYPSYKGKGTLLRSFFKAK
jgi:hypothetical protein